MKERAALLNSTTSGEEESDAGAIIPKAVVSKKQETGPDGKPIKFFRKRPDLKIPVLLAHLAAEKQFRATFEQQVRAIHPVQYKMPKKKYWKEGGGGGGLMSDVEGSSEFCKT